MANSGAFTMTSGTIGGANIAERGGGVYVDSNGTFNMSGGAISGNFAENGIWGGPGGYGGGVYVMNGGGSFVKTGGIIYGSDSPANANKTYAANTTDDAGEAVYDANKTPPGRDNTLWDADNWP